MKLLLALLALLVSSPAVAQGIPFTYLSASGTNCTLAHSGSITYKSGLFVNSTAVIYYLKLYDKATAPTKDDTPFRRIPILIAASGNQIVDAPPDGIILRNGLGFCLTGAITDTDVTTAATGVAINFTLH